MEPVEMADCLRPTDDAFKAVYERAYRLWYTLWKDPVATDSSFPPECLQKKPPSFPQHPYIPLGVDTDEMGILTATSYWATGNGTCDDSEVVETFQNIADVSKPTKTVISDDEDLELPWFSEDGGHIIVLFLGHMHCLPDGRRSWDRPLRWNIRQARPSGQLSSHL